jgi:hypothetical protein
MKTVKDTRIVLLFVPFLLLCLPAPQYAKVKPLYTYYDHSYGARSLSMGNAYTAVADDLSAVYTNPAGVAELDGPQAFLDFRTDKLNYAHLPETDTSGAYPQTYTYEFSSKLKNLNFISISAPVIFWDIKWSFALSYYRYIPYGFESQAQGKLVTTGNGWTNTDNTWLIIKGNSGIDVFALTGAFYLTNNLSFGITVQRFFNSGDISYSTAGPETEYIKKYS